MIENTRTLLWVMWVVTVLGMTGTAWGQVGMVELGGDGECSDPDCRIDAGGEEDDLQGTPSGIVVPVHRTFNFTVPLLDDGDFYEELNAMREQFQRLSPGFHSENTATTVTFDPYNSFGLDSLCIRSTGGAISLVEIQHPRDGLNAKIRKITDAPVGDGTITLWLNRYTPTTPPSIKVDTTGGNGILDADEVNDALVAGIGAAGFQFTETEDFIIVHRDQHIGSGWDLNQVSFETTDTGITTIEVALDPDRDNWSHCNRPTAAPE